MNDDALLNVAVVSGGDGPYAPHHGGEPDDRPQHYLDSPANQDLLRDLESWWIEARDLHADNRREMMLDADYYDCMQWSPEQAAVLEARGQAPLTFPLVKQMCDWLIGTERRTRIDWQVLPRKSEDVESAATKKDVLKYISDVNGAGWERSRQFADQVKVGVGWTEECYNNDQREEPVTLRYADWKSLWWDPYSRSYTLRDCRYLHRVKWLDLDYALAMMPDRADELRRRAVDNLDPMLEQWEVEATLPMLFYDTAMPHGVHSTGHGVGLWGMGSQRGGRRRVLAIETWYTKAINTPLLLGHDPEDELNQQVFDSSNRQHQAALADGTVSLVDSVSEEMRFAIWTPGCLLRSNQSPYKHGRYPFTPAWCYRRHRDGMPYGVVRPARDSQDEYNKRRSKILFELSTLLVLYEDGAFDEGDEHEMLDEIRRPDGEVRLKKGALAENRIKIERALDALAGQVQMLHEAKENIYESSGVTRENTGTSTGDQSGRAILAKQQQGSVTSAEIFDNFRQAIQESGLKTLSNSEQFLTLPKVIRIAGSDGAMRWVTINQPQFDPATGEVTFNNDIAASEADFVVDETDYRETVRMALAETLFELIGRMPPNVAMALLDEAVELTDLPNKTALANRIRKVTGMMPDGAENTPEGKAAMQQQQKAQAQTEALQRAQLEADVELTHAKARQADSKATLDAANANTADVRGKGEAMRTAGMVAQAPALAPAADRLWNPALALPASPNQYHPPEF